LTRIYAGGCANSTTGAAGANAASRSLSTFSLATTDSIGFDFNIRSFAVADRCKGHLQDFISIHDIQPLPAHDENHVLIQYESKLKGALIEVHMAIYRHLIKSKKHDVFNVELQKLIVLSPLATMLSSPFKRRRLDAGSCT
jgi:hypothetical protein